MAIIVRRLISFCSMIIAGCAIQGESIVPATATSLKVISVAEWGGTPADPAKTRPHVPTHITLHHGGVAFLRDRDPKNYLRNLQNWSRNTRMWSDIPYHYLIDLDGNVYEGRDIRYAGDTNTEYDPTGHALIVVLGNFEEVEPLPAQLDAIVETMAMLAVRFNVPLERIAGHRDYSAQTVCPGKSLYPLLADGTFRMRVAAKLRLPTALENVPR